MDDLGCRMFNQAAKPTQGLTMREKSQWTPRGIVLWLIAAILATLFVCTGTAPDPEPPRETSRGVDLEVEIVE